MDKTRSTQISRFLSYVLRHDPGAIGIALDEDGWANVEKVVVRVRERYPEFNLQALREIVREDQKQRYALSDDRIRAQQGHSIEIRDVGTVKMPPQLLYHGTTQKNWHSIQADGAIRPMGRQFVHLSVDEETAKQVASRRRGRDRVILIVRAADMHEHGHEFRRADNGVWLAKQVPLAFVAKAEKD